MFEIMECTLQVMKEKHLRNESLRSRKWDNWNALMEKTTRTIRKATRRPRRASWSGSSFPPKSGSIATEGSSTVHVNPPPLAPSKVPPPKHVHLGRRPRRISLGPTYSWGQNVTDIDSCSTKSSHTNPLVSFSPIVSPEKKRAKRLVASQNLPPLPGKAPRDVFYIDRKHMAPNRPY
jgi:hypothetical protein